MRSSTRGLRSVRLHTNAVISTPRRWPKGGNHGSARAPAGPGRRTCDGADPGVPGRPPPGATRRLAFGHGGHVSPLRPHTFHPRGGDTGWSGRATRLLAQFAPRTTLLLPCTKRSSRRQWTRGSGSAPCGGAAREDLVCILPLGVAVNSAGKLRLIWDGSWANVCLVEKRFFMEALQREGRYLFCDSVWSGTFDISQAY